MTFNTARVITDDRTINREFSTYKALLIVGILLTIIQQMPVIRDFLYIQIRGTLYLIFAVVSIKSLSDLSLLKVPRLVKLFLGVIIIIIIELLVLQLFSSRIGISDLTELVIPFGILISACNFNFKQAGIDTLTDVYVLLAVLMGVGLVLFYGEGFILREQYIVGTSNNQTGPILGIASIIVLDRILEVSRNRPNAVLRIVWYITLLVGGIASLIVLRNRAGLLAVLVVSFFMIILRSRRHATLGALIIATVVIILLMVFIYLGFLDPLVDTIVGAFTLNYDFGDLESLSAGRINGYTRGIEYIKLHPLFGELCAGEQFFGTPHNYILNKLVKYGIIGSMPFAVLYISLFVVFMREMFSISKKTSRRHVAVWLLFFGLIVSLFEFTYPYGPGSTQIMLWFLVGRFLIWRKAYVHSVYDISEGKG